MHTLFNYNEFAYGHIPLIPISHVWHTYINCVTLIYCQVKSETNPRKKSNIPFNIKCTMLTQNFHLNFIWKSLRWAIQVIRGKPPQTVIGVTFISFKLSITLDEHGRKSKSNLKAKRGGDNSAHLFQNGFRGKVRLHKETSKWNL